MCVAPKIIYKVIDHDTLAVTYRWRMLDTDCLVERVQIPCGRCPECERMRALTWSKRVILESRSHVQNCVLTLTYDNAHLPLENGRAVVSRRDIQLFLKRLRERIDVPIRYFGCAEYGAHGARPHYHLIIFGWCPSDLSFFFDKDGRKYYLSSFVRHVWKNGNILVNQDVDEDTARYCSLYFQKYNDTDGLVKPFLLFSRRPGIGLSGYDYSWCQTDKLYVGRPIATPRYFLKKLRQRGINVDYITRFRRNVRLVRRNESTFTTILRSKLLLRKFGLDKHLD